MRRRLYQKMHYKNKLAFFDAFFESYLATKLAWSVVAKGSEPVKFHLGPFPVYYLRKSGLDPAKPAPQAALCPVDVEHELYELLPVTRGMISDYMVARMDPNKEEAGKLPKNEKRATRALQAIIYHAMRRYMEADKSNDRYLFEDAFSTDEAVQVAYDRWFGLESELARVVGRYAKEHNLTVVTRGKWGEDIHRSPFRKLAKDHAQSFMAGFDDLRSFRKDHDSLNVLLYDSLGTFELNLRTREQRGHDETVQVRLFDGTFSAWFDVHKTAVIEASIRMRGIPALSPFAASAYEKKEAFYIAWNVARIGFYSAAKSVEDVLQAEVAKMTGYPPDTANLMAIVPMELQPAFVQLLTQRQLPLARHSWVRTMYVPCRIEQLDELYEMTARRQHLAWNKKTLRDERTVIRLGDHAVYELQRVDANNTGGPTVTKRGKPYYLLKLIDGKLTRAFLLNTLALEATPEAVTKKYDELFLKGLTVFVGALKLPVVTAQSWEQTVMARFLYDLLRVAKDPERELSSAVAKLDHEVGLLMMAKKPSTLFQRSIDFWGQTNEKINDKYRHRFYAPRTPVEDEGAVSFSIKRTAYVELILRALTVFKPIDTRPPDLQGNPPPGLPEPHEYAHDMRIVEVRGYYAVWNGEIEDDRTADDALREAYEWFSTKITVSEEERKKLGVTLQ